MSESGPTAEDLLFDVLDRRERGEAVDVDAICARYPQQAARLRELERDWRLAQGVTRDPTLEDPVADAALQDARVETSNADAGGSALLEQLRERANAAERYAVEGELGKGGMGVVLRVFDRDLRRRLAMKVLPEAARARGSRWMRFLEEAQVSAQLDHPGIVPVHELGLDREGRVFFTMKLVQGVTLEHVLAQLARGDGGWNTTRVIAILLRVCEAMAFAHAKGVVHRDLKPANIMVGRFGETYVMDWGVARVLGAPSAQGGDSAATTSISSERRDQAGRPAADAWLTHEGDVVGTPAYMAPEQAAGSLARVGPQSDVYAIGAMLHQALTGRSPSAEPRGRAEAALSRARTNAPPPPLPRTAPAELAAICIKAMEPTPERRYASMLALADDLRAYLEGRVVKAHASGAFAELRKWIGRNRGTAGALLVAMLALLAVGLVQWRRRVEVEVERERVAARKAEFDQLAGKVYLERARAAADTLYPAVPSRRVDLERWLAVDWARLDALRPRIDATIARIADRVSRADAALDDTPEGESQRFLHATLTQLSADIAAMERAETASVRARLTFATRLEALGAEHPAATVRWADAAAAIARADDVVASARYRDAAIALKPQLGLVPIGMNPVTRLWEFYDLRSACDVDALEDPARLAIPTHDARGAVVGVDDPGIVFVLLPGGVVDVGAVPASAADPDGDPRAANDEVERQVTLAPFFCARHELTKGQWLRLAGTDPSFYRYGPPYDGDPHPVGPTHPVEQVAWHDAELVLRRNGSTLPTEAQWEYAARAGTRTAWWSGRDPQALAGVANVLDRRAEARFPGWGRQEGDFDDGYCSVAPVGSFRANAFGLFDVHGNVWEWCLDEYASTPRDSRADDGLARGGDPALRVLRGGSFNDPAALARCSSRSPQDGSIRTPATGVRAIRLLQR
jgi:formylglycine-generating enzyme required for sulfatase activity/tRNA A-37 threonylcarbamoyl transferase component Bud32